MQFICSVDDELELEHHDCFNKMIGTVEINTKSLGHSSSDVGACLVTEHLALDWHFLENNVFC